MHNASPRARTARALILAAALAAWTPAITAAQTPPGWSPDVAELFSLYYRGRWADLEHAGRQMLRATETPEVQRDVSALLAMGQLRSSERATRTEGRAVLLGLAEHRPELLERPECLLAYGVAQREMFETSSALAILTDAADGFERQQRWDRFAVSLVELARAWRMHGEWDFPPAGLDVPVVRSTTRQTQVRLERLDQLRARAAGRTLPPDVLHWIELERARVLLAGDRPDEAQAALQALAGQAPLTLPTAHAALDLAAQRERAQDSAGAAELYQRVIRAGLPEVSELAAQRAAEQRAPHLALRLPDRALPDQPVDIDVDARNVAAVELEIRRVDLDAWLTNVQGRALDAQLPATGSVVAAHRLDLTGDDPSGQRAWRVESLPTGAFAVVAQAARPGGGQMVDKRLLIVSELQALVACGPDRAVIWAPGAPDVSARFWMHGSFVPTRPAFDGDLALFDLPPERDILRDRRWTCLVESAGQYALCRGDLAQARRQALAPPVVMIAAPDRPRAGERVRIHGTLLPVDGRQANLADQPVQIELIDPADVPLAQQDVTPDPAGSFLATFDVTEPMAGAVLRVRASLGGRHLPSAHTPLRISVLPAAPALHQIELTGPRWLPPDSPLIEYTVAAGFPWGTPLSNALFLFNARPLRLPVGYPPSAPQRGAPVVQKQELRPDGAYDLAFPWAPRFELDAPPVAALIRLEARGWDERTAALTTPLLIAERPAYLWLDVLSDEPTVGDPLPIRVNWLDPLTQAAQPWPQLELRRAGAPVAHPDLLPTAQGLLAQWTPPDHGNYEIVATLPLLSGDPLVARGSLDVEPTGDRPALPGLHATLEVRRQRVGANATLRAAPTQPTLLLLEAGNPIAAQVVSPGDAAPKFLEAPGGLPERARVHALQRTGHGLAVTSADIRVPAGAPLTLSADLAPPQPGGALGTLSLELMTPHETPPSILVRLVKAGESGAIEWHSRAVRPAGDADQPALFVIPSSGEPIGLGEPALAPETSAALLAGRSQWLAAAAAGQSRLPVEWPAEPGLYELIVSARDASGLRATHRTTLDTRAGLALTLDLPARLELGDRTLGALTLRNGAAEPRSVELALDLGAGLHLVELTDPDAGAIEPGADGRYRVDVPAHAQRTLRARLEAASPGAGRATASASAAGFGVQAAAAYRVVGAPSGAAARDPALQIERRVYRVEPIDRSIEFDAEATGLQTWPEPPSIDELQRTALAAGERVEPGQVLLVEDRFTTDQDLRDLQWRQRLPANCLTYKPNAQVLRRIGRRGEPGLSRLEFSTDRLSAGPQVHEFLLIAVRPGACRLPPPEVHAQVRDVDVAVESIHGHIVVSE